jgi:hypothetical protein
MVRFQIVGTGIKTGRNEVKNQSYGWTVLKKQTRSSEGRKKTRKNLRSTRKAEET